jgi:hypothetical protein
LPSRSSDYAFFGAYGKRALRPLYRTGQVPPDLKNGLDFLSFIENKNWVKVRGLKRS